MWVPLKENKHERDKGGVVDGIYLGFNYICLSDFLFANIVTPPPSPPPLSPRQLTS
jgi:hypothetical protein